MQNFNADLPVSVRGQSQVYPYEPPAACFYHQAAPIDQADGIPRTPRRLLTLVEPDPA